MPTARSLSHFKGRPRMIPSNWVPAPEEPFNLTMRFYGPHTSVLDGSYRLPAVARVKWTSAPSEAGPEPIERAPPPTATCSLRDCPRSRSWQRVSTEAPEEHPVDPHVLALRLEDPDLEGPIVRVPRRSATDCELYPHESVAARHRVCHEG